ncbi:MAG: hypothetical protein ACRC5T_11430, partial [Cetobacterium sp.]
LVEDESMYSYMLSSSRVETSWKNVIEYYKNSKYELDETLIEYLNLEINYKVLSQENIESKSYEEKVTEKIQLSISNNENIVENSLIELAKVFYSKLDKYEFNKISVEKINILIKSRVVDISPKVIKSLKLKSLNINTYLALIIEDGNLKKFLENQQSYMLSSEDWIGLFESDISEVTKVQMIKNINSNLTWEEFSDEALESMWKIVFKIKELEISQELLDVLIVKKVIKLTFENINYLKENDLEVMKNHLKLLECNIIEFLESHSKLNLSQEDKRDILNKLNFTELSIEQLKQVVQIILEQDNVTDFKEIISFVLSLNKTELEKEKLEIIFRMIDEVEKVELENIFFNLKGVYQVEEYNKILNSSKQPVISNMRINKKIVEKLKEKQYISSFKENEEKDEIRIFPKKI